MSSILIVGGDKIQGIKNILCQFEVDDINHWSGRKVGVGNKVIPQDTQLIVLITDWISHKFTKKIKETAAKRGVRIVYTPNGSVALLARLTSLKEGGTRESDCRKIQCFKWIKQSTKNALLKAAYLTEYLPNNSLKLTTGITQTNIVKE